VVLSVREPDSFHLFDVLRLYGTNLGIQSSVTKAALGGGVGMTNA
jgi:hypothetical protein